MLPSKANKENPCIPHQKPSWFRLYADNNDWIVWTGVEQYDGIGWIWLGYGMTPSGPGGYEAQYRCGWRARSDCEHLDLLVLQGPSSCGLESFCLLLLCFL